jgi:8-oxo-dGTP pyrophosphatase MutT (NUDIX family)
MPDDFDHAEPVIRRRGVVAVVMRDERFLAICRSELVVAPGKVCFPGGGIEGDETEPAALEREMLEELAVGIRPLRCVWRCVTSWGTSLAWWLGEIDAEAILVPNPTEVASVHWLTREQLLERADLLDSNRHFLEALAGGELEVGL